MAIHVTPNGTAAGTGLSWSSPVDLQTALGMAVSGEEIWALGDNNVWGVSGTYPITSTLNMNVSDVRLYGGFRGTETNILQRNAYIACNVAAFPNYFPFPSILRGVASLGQSIINVMANDCVVDGFLIENGGGAGVQGGGLYAGAGLSNLRFENLVFKNNSADNGGGMFLDDCDAELINSFFYRNNATNHGGGLYLQNCNNGVVVVNVLFAKNGVDADGNLTQNGGAIYMNNSTVEVINNTIADNQAVDVNSKGIYADNSNWRMHNSILFPDIFTSTNVPFIISECLLNQRPQTAQNCFFPPVSPDFVNSAASNYRLQATSPCINAGDPTYVTPQLTITDLEGRPRFTALMQIDLGAFQH